MSTTSVLNSVLAATSGSSTTGIDVTAAVDAVLYADRAPERAWQAQQTALAAQSTAINQLQNESSTLTESLFTLQDVNGALSDVTASSSNTGIVAATALPGTAAGTHTVLVNGLATTGSAYSSTVATSSTQLASGSFTITVGSTATTITTGSGAGTGDTLDELAATINGDSLGVTASVITDSTGSRLALVAQSSGTAADFSISSSGSLSFQKEAAADASLSVDGVPITSASNTVTGAISGVTLNLQSISPGTTPVILTVAPDTTSIATAVNAFVSAYNTLIADVNSQFVYNSTTGTTGALSSDSTVRALQSDLLGATNYSSGSGGLNSLASLGISTKSDGTLTVDSSTLSSAISSNLSGVTSFFQGGNANGFIASLETSLSVYTNPSQGAFTVDLTSISSENTDLTSQTSTLELYLSTVQANLTTEYNSADIALSQLPQTLKQINALLNPPSSGNS